MSYSFMNPCNNCQRRDGENPCKDMEKIQEAINNIHMSRDGSHQGSGNVVLCCYKCKYKYEV
jgi:hypothetical protein